jgi:hypothetical protein
MPGILEEKLFCNGITIVKHDSFDKAPFNDEALSTQQKLHGGSWFT